MPLYEYKCQSCGKTFEVLQKFADEPLKTHPECGGSVEKLLSAPAFHLKGTGWYATDYGKGNGKPAKSEDSKSESKSEKAEKSESKAESTSGESKSSEAKTESKPAASSEPKSSPTA
ncbi:MAG TPA: zinc ribbon domain-containing protein [Bryobacteraceae bacterium]|jgi:putative FmdB family regulatory protein